MVLACTGRCSNEVTVAIDQRVLDAMMQRVGYGSSALATKIEILLFIGQEEVFYLLGTQLVCLHFTGHKKAHTDLEDLK